MAYFGSVVQDGKVTGNVATLAEIEEVMNDEDGKIIPCWSGVSASNDPNLSYGKFLFERITSWITKHEL